MDRKQWSPLLVCSSSCNVLKRAAEPGSTQRPLLDPGRHICEDTFCSCLWNWVSDVCTHPECFLGEMSHYWSLLTSSLSWFRKRDNPLCVFPFFRAERRIERGEILRVLNLRVLFSNLVGLNLLRPFRMWPFLNSPHRFSIPLPPSLAAYFPSVCPRLRRCMLLRPRMWI